MLRDTEPATLPPRASARALASARLICSNVPVKTIVLPDNGDVPARIGAGASIVQFGRELVERLEIVRLGKELAQLLDQRRADAVDIVEFAPEFPSPVASCSMAARQRVEAAIVPGQHLRIDLADEADAQRVDESL